MTTRRAAIGALAALAVAVSAAAYLRDPVWLGPMTFGLREWEEDGGVRFRWTTGHATFFVPSDAAQMTLVMRGVFPSGSGHPTNVAITVDDRPVTIVSLADPAAWTHTVVPIPRRTTGRRVRRIDLRVSRTVGDGNLGIQLGDVVLDDGRRLPGTQHD